MEYDAFGLPKSVFPDAYIIQMLTRQVCLRTDNAGVGVSHWAVETMAIWQMKSSLTMQWIDNEVRERIWEFA